MRDEGKVAGRGQEKERMEGGGKREGEKDLL